LDQRKGEGRRERGREGGREGEGEGERERERERGREISPISVFSLRAPLKRAGSKLRQIFMTHLAIAFSPQLNEMCLISFLMKLRRNSNLSNE
jgi:hypothetical protein